MLPREARLRRPRDFSAVYARKKSWANALLVLYVRRYETSGENSETRRFGFSVSKKVGKAHDRNRIKRRLREICRSQSNRLRRGFDTIFVVRGAANTVDFAGLSVAVNELFQRAGLLVRSSPRETEGSVVSDDATPGRGNGSFPAEPDVGKEQHGCAM